jgi:hypothetical protein
MTDLHKGTGVGGAETNHNGKAFEQTDNEKRLLSDEYIHLFSLKHYYNII